MSSRNLRSRTKQPREQPAISPGDQLPPSKRSKKKATAVGASNETTQAGNEENTKSDGPATKAASSTSGLKGNPTSATQTAAAATKGSEKKSPNLSEHKGDIFAAPPRSLLVHACNCEGHWGAGIAKAFRQHYPDAFEIYQQTCAESGHDLLDTALLIPPEESKSGSSSSGDEDARKSHFVGCLFTSRGFGSRGPKKKDAPERILQATGPAFKDLMDQVANWNSRAEGEGKDGIGEVRICKINSGLFGVPWEETRKVLEEVEVDEQEGVVEVGVWER